MDPNSDLIVEAIRITAIILWIAFSVNMGVNSSIGTTPDDFEFRNAPFGKKLTYVLNKHSLKFLLYSILTAISPVILMWIYNNIAGTARAPEY